MKVGDLVIVGNLGEIRVYKANPRDLEAEAGLKPENIKLDLVEAFNYPKSHWELHEIVSDEAGRFRLDASKNGANIGEDHNLENKLKMDAMKLLAEDIAKIVEKEDVKRYFLALPGSYFNKVFDEIKKLSSKYIGVDKKLFKYLKEDIVKSDKSKIIELFKNKGEHHII